MGVESFSILLRAERLNSIASVLETIESFGQTKFVKKTEFGNYYEYYDAKYLFEILVRGDNEKIECDVNIRFSLCNEDGIENVFLKFVKTLTENFTFSIYLLSSLQKEKTFFDKNETELFLETAKSEIQSLKKFWQKSFGNKRGAIRSEEVFDWLEESNN